MKIDGFKILKLVSLWKKNSNYSIPKNYEKKLAENVLISNNTRATIVCVVFTFLTLFQLILLYRPKHHHSHNLFLAYRNLALINILIVITCLVYLIIINSVSLKEQIRKIKFYKFFLVIFIFTIQLLNTLTSVNAQLYNGDITAFIAIMLIFSIVSIVEPYKSILISFTNFALLIIGLYLFNVHHSKLHPQTFNAFLVMIFAILLSIMNYYNFAKSFIQKSEILNKAEELEIYKNHLEELIEERTADLVQANANLLEETHIRHKAELEAIQSNIKYEEKERLLNKAVEYEKIRTEFFANISHELRTPLNVIFCAEQMLDIIFKGIGLDNDDQFKTDKYLHTIKQNSYRLLRLINNLIDITKMDAGYFEVTLSNNDIVKITEDITLSVVEYAENKNIRVIFDTEIEEKIIACDPDKIERIMLNLLSNAVKFTPKNGYIYVNIYNMTDKVIISVKDTGIGIDKSMQKLIFDRFVQVDKSISRRTEGSGIGLSLVKSLVEMHNGQISVVSELGEGSEFIIELPKVQAKTDNIKIEESNVCKKNKNIEKINLEFSDIYF
ncbi:ATP-binding protein [Clostridium scatologenes]|uniref:histidine kinase n=1 Tax=Clostridium scatologenes TaxID=1548 RepID=A0A0E3JX89_CLOSL|nr:ATP-binding protein [Clostridium scatologenes]AKA67899.1 ATPase, histidine kinase-, DNA gyrase B-, and HSP90-like domain protein [Clostridium scatologenes]